MKFKTVELNAARNYNRYTIYKQQQIQKRITRCIENANQIQALRNKIHEEVYDW